MSLIKLAAFGAEVLDIMDRSEEWNSDTWDLVMTTASRLGLHSEAASEDGLFSLVPELKEPAFHLLEDFEKSVENCQQLCLTLARDDKTVEFYPGAIAGEPSGVSVLIKNRSYEL